MKNLNILDDLISFKKLTFEEALNSFKSYKNYSFFEHIFNNSLFPKNSEEIKTSSIINHVENVEGELAFIVFLLIRNKDKINKFLVYEKQFQKKLLKQDYDSCFQIIEKVNSEICYSLWGIENKFCLLQTTKGIEKNWEFNNELIRKIKNPIINLFISFYSRKTEKETTVLNYFNELEILTKKFKSEEKEYLNFVLGNKNFYYEKFSYIINYHSNSSLIDLYYHTISILNHLGENKDNHKMLNIAISLLSKEISDIRLTNLKNISSFSSVRIVINDDLSINILNTYSKGDYLKALEMSTKFLRENPDVFFIYEIYIKSILHLKLDFKKTLINETIDEILFNLYSLFEKKENYYSSKEYLLKQALIYSKVNFYIQMFSFVFGYTEKSFPKTLYNEYFIFCEKVNPQSIHLNFHNKKKSFKADLNKNLCILINYLIFTKNFDLIDKLEIPKKKIKLYKSRIHYLNQETGNSVKEMLDDLLTEDLDNYTLEEVSGYYISCLTIEQDISKIADIVVSSFFKNKFLIEKINLEKIISLLVEINYSLSYININLPILFYLNNVDSYYQYVSLEIFLQQEKIEKVSELDINKYDFSKILLLLEKIASIETLNNFYLQFNNEEEIINERIQVLNILKAINFKQIHEYDEEINLLKQKHSIKKILKNLNNGRIYFNFQKTVENNKNNYLVNFNRLKQIQNYIQENDIDFLDTNLLVESYLKQITDDRSLLNKADYISFKSLYLDVLEGYLFSNEYGLNGILSTRFRHGEIENKIRNIFSSFNLISTKDNDLIYTDIDYWNNYKIYDGEQKIPLLQEKFKIFSEQIDNLISFIVFKKVQINSVITFNNEKALFNFINSDAYIWLLYKDFKNNNFSFDEFIDYLSDVIRLNTEALLKITINYFNTDVKKEFLSIINTFQKEFGEIISIKDLLFDFNQKINFIKTKLELELDEISKWFKINNIIDSTSLEFKTIINIVMESFNLDINYEVLDYSKTYFDRAYYYIDILRILVDNAVKYSKLESLDLKLKFIIDRKEVVYTTNELERVRQKITITLQNNFKDSVDIDSLNECFKKIKKNWENNLSKANYEGGSGFKKIGKMLKYDIKATYSEFDYLIEGENLSIILNYEI